MAETKYCSTSCSYFVFKGDCAFCCKNGIREIDREVINYTQAMLCDACDALDAATANNDDKTKR